MPNSWSFQLHGSHSEGIRPIVTYKRLCEGFARGSLDQFLHTKICSHSHYMHTILTNPNMLHPPPHIYSLAIEELQQRSFKADNHQHNILLRDPSSFNLA